MRIDKFTGKLSTEVVVDKNAILKGGLISLQLKLIDKKFRLVFFRRK